MNLIPNQTSIEKLCWIKTTAASRFGLTVIPAVLREQWLCEKEEYLKYRYSNDNNPRNVATDPMNYGIDFPQFNVWVYDYFGEESNLVSQILKQSHFDNELSFKAYAAMGVKAIEIVKAFQELFEDISGKSQQANFKWDSSFEPTQDNVEFLNACCDMMQDRTTLLLKQWELLCQEHAMDAAPYFINLFDRLNLAHVVTISQEKPKQQPVEQSKPE